LLKRWLAYLWIRLPETSGEILSLTVSLSLVLVGVNLVVGLWDVFSVGFFRGVGHIFIVGPLAFYSFLLGPAIVQEVSESARRGHRPTLTKLAMTPFSQTARRFKDGGASRVIEVAISVVGALLFVGILIGFIYLVDRFAGRIGHWLLLVLSVLGIAMWPVTIAVAVVRAVRSGRKVNRAISAWPMGSLSAGEFVRRLMEFNDPLEQAEYVRRVRVAQSEGLASMSRTPVRQLIELAEGQRFLTPDEVPLLVPELASLWRRGSIRTETLRGLTGDVLDELSRLEEGLRLSE
jgi:hypothetical protein